MIVSDIMDFKDLKEAVFLDKLKEIHESGLLCDFLEKFNNDICNKNDFKKDLRRFTLDYILNTNDKAGSLGVDILSYLQGLQ